jgi:hypothetical protein
LPFACRKASHACLPLHPVSRLSMFSLRRTSFWFAPAGGVPAHTPSTGSYRRRFGAGGYHRSDQFIFDQVKPRFGAIRAVPEVFNLRLQLLYPIFDGSKITRKLICPGLGALATVCSTGRPPFAAGQRWRAQIAPTDRRRYAPFSSVDL